MKPEKTTRKIWITKYALTQGITTAMAEVDGEPGEELGTIRGKGLTMTQYLHRRKSGNNDFEFSEEDALARAEVMRENKIASLNRQLGKLKTLKIKVKDDQDS